jgi:hypothetical protein
VKAIGLPVADSSKAGLDLCYQSLPESASIPNVTFHFEGGDLEVSRSQYFVRDPDTGLTCSVLMPSMVPIVSIIGGVMLANFHVLYDLGNNLITFTPAECGKL